IKILREEMSKEFKVILGRQPAGMKGNPQERFGSLLSDRRGGFPNILQHDTVLSPAECGGPLVDLDGKVVGIHIARAGRVESYAIPSEVVRKLIPEMKDGKYTLKAE